jgi:hypothetical protein
MELPISWRAVGRWHGPVYGAHKYPHAHCHISKVYNQYRFFSPIIRAFVVNCFKQCCRNGRGRLACSWGAEFPFYFKKSMIIYIMLSLLFWKSFISCCSGLIS